MSQELCMKIRLSRVQQGYSVTVWASPLVEEFMKSLGTGRDGDTEDLSHFGGRWRSTSEALRVWNASNMDNVFRGQTFTLDSIGAPLDLTHTHGEQWVNLSFLRLVGISREGGVTFVVQGVHTLEALRTIKNNIATGVQRLYSEFIRPVDLSIELVTSEQRG